MVESAILPEDQHILDSLNCTIIPTLRIMLNTDKDIVLVLARLPIACWSSMVAQTFLGYLMIAAKQHERVVQAKAIMDHYQRVRKDPLAPGLWIQTANLPPAVKTWAQKQLLGRLACWELIVEVTDGDLAVLVAQSLHQSLPLTAVSEWHNLIALTEASKNPEISNGALRQWLIQNQPLEDYPAYLPTATVFAQQITTLFGEGPGKIMPVLKVLEVDYNSETIGDPEVVKESIEMLISLYGGSRYLARCKMAMAAMQLLSIPDWQAYNDTAVHQRYGPVNAVSKDPIGLHNASSPCYKYGGCRMLGCQEFEQPDDDGSIGEWFTGRCVQCTADIMDHRSAVRQPLIHGGWRGCFCSWYCVANFVEEVGYEEEDKEIIDDLIDRASYQLELEPIV